jgi:very-short-patch-repair endonuclease
LRSTPRIKVFAKQNRQKQTQAEVVFWEAVRRKEFEDFKFYRQRPIGRYIADFYCPKLNLVVEVDGPIHEEPEQKEYDQYRDKVLRGKGLTVIRFLNEQVIQDLTGCLESIKQYILHTHARKDFIT